MRYYRYGSIPTCETAASIDLRWDAALSRATYSTQRKRSFTAMQFAQRRTGVRKPHGRGSTPPCTVGRDLCREEDEDDDRRTGVPGRLNIAPVPVCRKLFRRFGVASADLAGQCEGHVVDEEARIASDCACCGG